MSKKVLDELLQPLVEELGYEFVGLEYSSNPKNAVLRIYIDAEDGVGVDDCSRVSREVAALLDVEDPIPGHYNLEISSPGLDRPLFTLAQYERFTGSEVKLSLFAPQDGRRKLKGVILGVDLEQVRIAVEDVEMVVYFNNIAKANLVPDYARLMAGDGDSELQAD